MFYYLKGTPALKGENFIVIDVGGVGYKVYTSASNLATVNSDFVTFYTYMYIREDIMDIFGFLTTEELGLFENLISVSGVGPKAALAILSALSPKDLILAIISNDTKSITKAPGVGAKIAQRIILELKGKLSDEEIKETAFGTETFIHSDNFAEAVNALVSLGYSAQEARHAMQTVPENLTLEDSIMAALKNLAR